MIRAIDRVSGPPSFTTTGRLETLIQTMYGFTQARVHVISGRLRASGRTETDMANRVWSGSILYGGPSGHPAYYGIYEMRRRGVKPGLGPHDFFAGLEAFDPQFEAAIDRHFDPLWRN